MTIQPLALAHARMHPASFYFLGLLLLEPIPARRPWCCTSRASASRLATFRDMEAAVLRHCCQQVAQDNFLRLLFGRFKLLLLTVDNVTIRTTQGQGVGRAAGAGAGTQWPRLHMHAPATAQHNAESQDHPENTDIRGMPIRSPTGPTA